MKRISIRHRYEGVCPSVVHANGVVNTRLWEIIRDQFFAAVGKFNPVCDHGQQQEWANSLTLMTWNTGANMGSFEMSCKALGVQAYVIQKPIKLDRANTRITYPLKVEATLEFIGQVKTEFVMFVDSYDALLLESPARILGCFLHNYKHNDVVFGAEKGRFPKGVVIDSEIISAKEGVKRPYLNSGFCFGRTKNVAEIYCKAKDVGDSWDYEKNGMLTDQGAIKSVVDERVKIDYGSRMCLNLFGTGPGELELLYVNNGIRLETV